jgi:hypothetical protein
VLGVCVCVCAAWRVVGLVNEVRRAQTGCAVSTPVGPGPARQTPSTHTWISMHQPRALLSSTGISLPPSISMRALSTPHASSAASSSSVLTICQQAGRRCREGGDAHRRGSPVLSCSCPKALTRVRPLLTGDRTVAHTSTPHLLVALAQLCAGHVQRAHRGDGRHHQAGVLWVQGLDVLGLI